MLAVVLDAAGTLVYCNDSFLEVAGWERDEALGRNWFDDFLPRDVGPGLRLIYSSVPQNVPAHCTSDILTKSGERRTIAWNNTLRVQDQGQILGVISIGEDVTEPKRTEYLLRDQRDFLEKLIDNAPIGVAVVTGPDFRFSMANPYYLNIPGEPGIEMLGRKVADVFPAFAQQGGVEIFKRVRESRSTIRLREYMTPVGPGRLQSWWNVELLPLEEEGKPEVDSILIIAHDVTEEVQSRRRVEELAAASETNLRKLEGVIASMTEGVIVADSTGRILSLNPAAVRMHGLEDVNVGNSLGDFFGLFDVYDIAGRPLPIDYWPLARATRGETFSKYRVRVRSKKDNRTWIGSYAGTQVRDKNEKTLLAILTVVDVTDIEEAKAALQATHDQLEMRVVERTEELRCLIAYLDTVREEESRRIAAEIHDQLGQALTVAKIEIAHLKTIAAEGQASVESKLGSLSNLVTGILEDVRRISRDLRPPLLDQLGLPAALENFCEDFEKRTGIQCIYHPDDERELQLGPERATAVFRIAQEALTNVARHAGASRVDLRLAVQNGYLHLSVQDNGKGIPAHANPKSAGLIGMKERALRLGGELIIRGAPGSGTRVELRAPAIPEP